MHLHDMKELHSCVEGIRSAYCAMLYKCELWQINDVLYVRHIERYLST